MAKPLIGISTYLEDEARWGVWRLPAALLPAGYHQLVQRAGGLAALLPPDGAPGAADEAIARLDGLVIAGGPDVRPARYGAEPHPRTGPPALARDAWELALIAAALDRGLPLLGICRGLQLLNVLRGGTLHQHLPDVVGHPHHAGPPGQFARHEIIPVPGTLTARLLPTPVSVPTYHHQAVDRVAPDLTPSAHTADGTVEALEFTTPRPFALAVQWHPEAGDDDRLMRALVGAAGGAAPVPAA
ncbi:gamma-glutamyl-gamma-aminobutyrate hydrolase family protein [Streptomyces buecherae]|uniref:gamma-glutamyl-gamma-aminobutyrate hydrolase family protein n=1 Tax=Streptomyces buecherae TaxID=2763006 RepID=UPI0033D8EC4D